MKTISVLLLLFTTFISTAQISSLVMESEAGDYIGQGQNYNLTEADGTFTAHYYEHNGSVRISFSGNNGSFSVSLQPMETRALIIGPYLEATGGSYQSPTKPGFNASGFGRGCTAFSEFTVLEIEVLNEEVVKFAADFEQHCGSIDSPSLTGRVSFNSDGAPFPAIPDSDNDTVYDTLDNCVNVANSGQANADSDLFGDACDPMFTNTSLILDSEVGDYIGQGEYQHLYLIDGNMSAERNFDNGVTVDYDGGAPWTLNFAAAGDTDLTVGVYDLATRYPFQDISDHGLSVSGDGRGCNTLSGSFEVHRADYNDLGEVIFFDASYIQHCDSDKAALTGRVKVDQRGDLIFQDGFENL